MLHEGKAGEGDAEQDGEGGGLGCGGHHPDDGGGCALVDVGGPDVKGGGGDLEAEADENHGEGQEGDTWGGGGAEALSNAGDGGRAGRTVGKGHSVEEEGRCEGSKEKVFERGLRPGCLALAEAGHDVGGDGGDLEADEDHQEFDGAGHEHHADGGEEREGEVLACVGGGAFKEVERAQQRDENDGCDEELEEDGEGVHLDGAGEGCDGPESELVQACGPRGERSEDGEPAEGLAGLDGVDYGLGEHDEDADCGEDDLGQEGEEVGGH